MSYTISQFNKDFPSDDACLQYIFNSRYGASYKCPQCGKMGFYRVKGRKAYASSCGYQLFPTAGTIFHKSDTSLKNWFYAMYIFSNAKNGTASKEIQRHLGCTYKTAWRIGYKIRSLMKQGGGKLSGIVETDEVYIGGKTHRTNQHKNKSIVVGYVQRNGQIKAKHIPDASTSTLLANLSENVKFGSRVITDENVSYKPNKILRLGMLHDTINHSKKEYVRDDVYTNTIESFWGQLKRSIHGTYHSVSAKHLQTYVDQFSYLYNLRASSAPVFYDLLGRVCGKPYQAGQKIVSLVRVS